jgi:hypothetical protein
MHPEKQQAYNPGEFPFSYQYPDLLISKNFEP